MLAIGNNDQTLSSYDSTAFNATRTGRVRIYQWPASDLTASDVAWTQMGETIEAWSTSSGFYGPYSQKVYADAGKLSGDGKEILCGTKGAHLMVYDLVANRMVTKVEGCHSDEINSVCFANRSHSNIIFSGSDDGMVKVWDRRALNSNRPAGVFVGHA